MPLNRSQAARTSSVVSFLTHSSTAKSFIDAISLAYSFAPDMAAAKILGLVVTPTTQSLAIREGSEWGSTPEIFARERSSNQMDVPLAPTSPALISVQL